MQRIKDLCWLSLCMHVCTISSATAIIIPHSASIIYAQQSDVFYTSYEVISP